MLPLTPALSANDRVILDGFEGPEVRIVRPSKIDNPKLSRLWNQYEGDFTEGPDPGTVSLTSSPKNVLFGKQSLKVNVTDGNVYLQLYTYEDDYAWHNMREYLTDGQWTFDKYNRMRFWMKLPPGISNVGGGENNFKVGTYLRASNGDKGSAESGGGHFYHTYDIASTGGVWQQVIVDMHPNHERGQPGDKEHNYIPYRTGEAGYNYFDAMTRFYVEVDGKTGIYPSEFYFDGFEFYHDPNDENLQQVYGVTGAYIPESNLLLIQWSRDKNEGTIKHEVRYAFSSVHSIGWDNALVAPSGMITPPNKFAYNGMGYKTTNINLDGKNSVFIAIKPENSSKFREIEIPMDPLSLSMRPRPPAKVSADKK